MPGKLFIVSAPSGAGKTTLVEHLIGRLGVTHPLSRVVTYTTKTPRPQDQDKRDYCFVSVAEFEQKITQDYFLEWSNTYGHYYGSPSTIIDELQAGRSLIVIVDQVGARQLKEKIEDAVLIWLYTASLQVLKERLVIRGTENEAQIERRLRLAETEILYEKKERFYDFHVLNEDFFQAINELEAIFLKYIQN